MSSGVFGVIAPHPPIMVEAVGGRRAKVTERSTQALREAAALLTAYDPDTLVLMSPHSPPLADAFIVDSSAVFSGSLAQFGAPESGHRAAGDPTLAREILDLLGRRGFEAVDRATDPQLSPGLLDHGVLVPLHFLDPEGRWPLVVLSLSWLDYASHRALGEMVAEAAQNLGRRIAFIASGDCAHRLTPDAPAGYAPRAAEFDALLVGLIGESDFDALSRIDPDLIEEAGECGLRSFIALGGAAAPAHARVLAYEGPWGVGYLTAVVNEGLTTPSQGAKGGTAGKDASEIVALARSVIERYVCEGATTTGSQLHDPALPAAAGAFVSLHRGGELRGCIGTISPVRDSLAAEVERNAIEAATRDPRFAPVMPDELLDLEISVDVLHEPEPAVLSELDPARYGVIVSAGSRRGLLLPDLEGVDTVEQQVAIARRKAGIGPTEEVRLMRFRVDRYS